MAKSTVTTFASQTFNAKLDRDHKRATDARRKYAYGTTSGGPGSTRVRPAMPTQLKRYDWNHDVERPQHFTNPLHIRCAEPKGIARGRTENAFDLSRATANGNHVDFVNVPVEPGCHDDEAEDFMYSYDHATGPSTGSDVLGAAIDRAIARFENQVTETLVKDEYSVVDENEATEERESEQDEDFELI